jgi:hypothetical protein
MKLLQIILFSLAAFGSTVAKAAPDMVGPMVLNNVRVADVLSIYEMISEKKIAVPSEVKAVEATITARLERKPKEEVLQFIEASLALQAGIEILREPNGDLSAKRKAKRNDETAAEKKPNQSSEPTAPSGRGSP